MSGYRSSPTRRRRTQAEMNALRTAIHDVMPEGAPMTLGPTAASEARRILDRAARRLLAARLDRDPVETTTGADDGSLDDRPNQSAPLVDGEQVPIPHPERDRG